MKYLEEDLATGLGAELKRKFMFSPISTSVEGAGVHWHCTAERDESSCSIACFTTPGPEYYTDFKRDSANVATARISSRAQTIAAVAAWLDRCGLSELHGKFPFVDQTKRTLKKLRDDVLSAILHHKNRTSNLQSRKLDVFRLRVVIRELRQAARRA